VDHAHRRQDRRRQQGGTVEVRKDAPRHPPGDPRDVHPLDPGEPRKEIRPGSALFFPLFDERDDLEHRFLAVPDEEGVEEGGHGSGVQGAHAPGHHEGVLLRSVLRQEGDPGEVEHREDVRVGEFVAQGESEEVERPGGSPRFKRRERQPGGAQMLLVVGPWGEDAVAKGPGPRGEDLAQKQDPEVRHPDLVHVGKGEQHAHARFVPRDRGRADFAAAVPGRLPDGRGNFAHIL
jgi:hypothetical protein